MALKQSDTENKSMEGKETEDKAVEKPAAKTATAKVEDKPTAKKVEKPADTTADADTTAVDTESEEKAESKKEEATNDDDQEISTGSGYTKKMLAAAGQLNDGKARYANKVVFSDGDPMKIPGTKINGMVVVGEDVYVERLAPGSKTTKVRTLKYVKGSLVSEAEMKKVSK